MESFIIYLFILIESFFKKRQWSLAERGGSPSDSIYWLCALRIVVKAAWLTTAFSVSNTICPSLGTQYSKYIYWKPEWMKEPLKFFDKFFFLYH